MNPLPNPIEVHDLCDRLCWFPQIVNLPKLTPYQYKLIWARRKRKAVRSLKVWAAPVHRDSFRDGPEGDRAYHREYMRAWRKARAK